MGVKVTYLTMIELLGFVCLILSSITKANEDISNC